MALKTPSVLLLAIPLSAFSIACGGGDNNTGAQTGANTGIAAGHADACKTPIHSGYPGDDLCIDPPAAAEGFQLHFGPADYDDPDEVAKYVLAPGAEAVKCVYLHTPNTELKYYDEYHSRMRSGTHHMILWAPTADNHDKVTPPADGTLTDSCRDLTYTFALGAQAALGAGGGVLDVPLPGKNAVAPENEGLAYQELPTTSVAMETHYINTTPNPILREVWLNINYEDSSLVKTKIDSVFFIGGLSMNVLPHTQQSITAGPAQQPVVPAGQQVRVLGLSGHVHAHTTHETVWLNHASGGKDVIYDTYNWEDPIIAEYDTAHHNPVPGASPGADGAASGDLILQAGDTISWQCDVNNTTDAALKFADLAYTAEMCNVFGFFVPGTGGEWGSFNP
jgi:hypothetical protein